MKFAFISTMHKFPWGGSEELWSQAAARLVEEGHEVHVSVGHWPQMFDKIKGLMKLGVNVETHDCFRSSAPTRAWNKLSLRRQRNYKRLRHSKPDFVVISQGYNKGGFDWAKICRESGIPYAIVVHCNSRLWWFEEQVLDDAVSSYTAARKVFCVSQNNLELLRLQVADPLPNGEIVINPYGVPPVSPPKWPESDNTWRLACVARLDLGAKGQDLLLQVMARREWRDRPVELNLFGAGPGLMTLHRLNDLLGLSNVQLRGHVRDIRGIWESNHLLVLPSRYEGLPLALVEAMWCGRPSVVTDVGGNAELCFDGETGFLASAATTASLANALERAWNRRYEWRQLGASARSRVECLIPRDPVAIFCGRLKACAMGNC